jgi:hypothetical protein
VKYIINDIPASVKVKIGRINDLIIKEVGNTGSLNESINVTGIPKEGPIRINIGAIINVGIPKNRIMKNVIVESTQVPLLYPDKTPNPIPKIEEKAHAGTVTIAVYFNGSKNTGGGVVYPCIWPG